MKKDNAYIAHILDAIELIEEYVQGASWRQFEKNTMMRDAVVRQLEIIGEAARVVSDGFKEKHPEIEWHQIVGMRNRLIHEYISVDEEEVYRTAKFDIPKLKELLESV